MDSTSESQDHRLGQDPDQSEGYRQRARLKAQVKVKVKVDVVVKRTKYGLQDFNCAPNSAPIRLLLGAVRTGHCTISAEGQTPPVHWAYLVMYIHMCMCMGMSMHMHSFFWGLWGICMDGLLTSTICVYMYVVLYIDAYLFVYFSLI